MESIAKILLVLIGPMLAIAMKYIPADAVRAVKQFNPVIDEIQRQIDIAAAAQSSPVSKDQAAS